MPKIDEIECFMTTYLRPGIAQETINILRRSTKDKIKITVFDNSPYLGEFSGVHAAYNFPFNASISRLWNWAIAMAKTDWVMIVGDDQDYRDRWVDVIEFDEHMNTSSIHGHFSSFLFHRGIVKDVGWFDERFTGGFYEDQDYLRRCNNSGHFVCGQDCELADLMPRVPRGDSHPDNKEYSKKIRDKDHGWHRINEQIYMDKWGDTNINRDAVGVPEWECVNWYPMVQLPENVFGRKEEAKVHALS